MVSDANSLMGQQFLAPMVQRISALETKADAQTTTLKGMIDNTQASVEAEMQKVKGVIDAEIARANGMATGAHTYASNQVATVDKLRQDWHDASVAMWTEYGQAIVDDKSELEKYQHDVEILGQSLDTEVQMAQQRIVDIQNV